jgi:hypothetical protein
LKEVCVVCVCGGGGDGCVPPRSLLQRRIEGGVCGVRAGGGGTGVSPPAPSFKDGLKEVCVVCVCGGGGTDVSPPAPSFKDGRVGTSRLLPHGVIDRARGCRV